MLSLSISINSAYSTKIVASNSHLDKRIPRMISPYESTTHIYDNHILMTKIIKIGISLLNLNTTYNNAFVNKNKGQII